MQWSHRLTQIPVRRHVRHLCARGRVHWKKWNGWQRPLGSPPGFESFHAKAEMRTGLKDWSNWPRNLEQLLETFRPVVKPCKHSFHSQIRRLPYCQRSWGQRLKNMKRSWRWGKMVSTWRKDENNLGITKQNQGKFELLSRTGRGRHRNGLPSAEHHAEDRANIKKRPGISCGGL